MQSQQQAALGKVAGLEQQIAGLEQDRHQLKVMLMLAVPYNVSVLLHHKLGSICITVGDCVA